MRELRNTSPTYPKKKWQLIHAVKVHLGKSISESTFEKDIHFLTQDTFFGIKVPIKNTKSEVYKPNEPEYPVGYYLEDGFCFSDSLFVRWGV